jgi:Holliday junction resolvase RusA-like endonuclease
MAATLVVEFFVPGIPVQQGSKTAFVNRHSGRAAVTDQNKAKLRPWRQTVTATAADSYSGDRVEGPVLFVAEFRFVRPASVSAKKRPHPSVKPDLDKLLRALMDGVTDAGLWRDDALVVEAHVSKVYAERPGVQVRIGEFREESKN